MFDGRTVILIADPGKEAEQRSKLEQVIEVDETIILPEDMFDFQPGRPERLLVLVPKHQDHYKAFNFPGDRNVILDSHAECGVPRWDSNYWREGYAEELGAKGYHVDVLVTPKLFDEVSIEKYPRSRKVRLFGWPSPIEFYDECLKKLRNRPRYHLQPCDHFSLDLDSFSEFPLNLLYGSILPLDSGASVWMLERYRKSKILSVAGVCDSVEMFKVTLDFFLGNYHMEDRLCKHCKRAEPRARHSLEFIDLGRIIRPGYMVHIMETHYDLSFGKFEVDVSRGLCPTMRRYADIIELAAE